MRISALQKHNNGGFLPTSPGFFFLLKVKYIPDIDLLGAEVGFLWEQPAPIPTGSLSI